MQNGATLKPDIVSGVLFLKWVNVFLVHGTILHSRMVQHKAGHPWPVFFLTTEMYFST